MTAKKLKQLYFDFFTSQNHQIIPSASLIPQNDPTTLFISAGMHPLVPYLLGQPHPAGQRLVNIQRCLRTGDIDQVGDTTHHTFFEMLGNWSLGDYFKKESITYSYNFVSQILKLDLANLTVTCFAGDANAPKDTTSASTWKSLGINKIKFLPKKDNWWGPAGQTGPCGPDTEIFYQGVEIWNNVFMEYNKTAAGSFVPLAQKNVDTGMGVERAVAVLCQVNDDYLTPIWQPIIKTIQQVTSSSYSTTPRPIRIIADHLRAAVLVVADGITPGNKEQGYVLRRLIRRSIVKAKTDLGVDSDFTHLVTQAIIANHHNFADDYSYLDTQKQQIISTISQEEKRFRQTLKQGLKKFNQMISGQKSLSGTDIFNLYQSYGFPPDLTKELCHDQQVSFDQAGFDSAQAQHQQQSRQLSSGKYKSGLADHSDSAIKYHTATHLLQAALRQILGSHVRQSGSNITPDRLRFDFSHPQPLTSQQVNQIEKLVNQQITAKIPIKCRQLPFSQAQKAGALTLPQAQYPDQVSVYSIGQFSAEVCAGPHVDNTSQLGHFVITKQESLGQGKRRLYAILK